MLFSSQSYNDEGRVGNSLSSSYLGNSDSHGVGGAFNPVHIVTFYVWALMVSGTFNCFKLLLRKLLMTESQTVVFYFMGNLHVINLPR